MSKSSIENKTFVSTSLSLSTSWRSRQTSGQIRMGHRYRHHYQLKHRHEQKVKRCRLLGQQDYRADNPRSGSRRHLGFWGGYFGAIGGPDGDDRTAGTELRPCNECAQCRFRQHRHFSTHLQHQTDYGPNWNWYALGLRVTTSWNRSKLPRTLRQRWINQDWRYKSEQHLILYKRKRKNGLSF